MQRKFNWPRDEETFKSDAFAQNRLDLSQLSSLSLSFFLKQCETWREIMREAAIIAEKLECVIRILMLTLCKPQYLIYHNKERKVLGLEDFKMHASFFFKEH